MKSTPLALALQNCIPGQPQINRDVCRDLTIRASRLGADIILFPEMNLTGYISGKAIRPLSEPIPGESTRFLTGLAKQEGITILAGIAENNSAGQLFSTHVMAKPDGSIDVYRKTHIAPPEKSVFSPGNETPVFQTPFMNIGIQLCYDAHFPELSTAMALKGADVLCIPHASPRGTSLEKFTSWMRHLTARAFDNGVFVVACNQVGDNGNGLFFPGIALAIGPDGNLIDRYEGTTNSLVVVKLEKKQMDRVRRHRMRYFLPNRRDDLY